MSVRKPFEMPEGCPPIEFDTDIVPADFALCVIPPFEDPNTGALHVPPFMVPGPQPPLCPCIPEISVSEDGTEIIQEDGDTAFSLDMEIRAKDPEDTDCCFPDNETYKIFPTLHLPKKLFELLTDPPVTRTFHTEGEIHSDCEVASAGFNFSETSSTVTLDWDICIPCYPGTLETETDVTYLEDPEAEPELAFAVEKLKDCGGLKFDLELKLPACPDDLDKTVVAEMRWQDNCIQQRKETLQFRCGRLINTVDLGWSDVVCGETC